jgi:two-component system, chemotaxis family, CheB/CheR fusion protein
MEKTRSDASSKKNSVVRKPAKELTPRKTGQPEVSPAPLETVPFQIFPIVGIGASAGGLAAIEAFLTAMPSATEKGIAFVIVQHLSPDHKSILTELLKRCTQMGVFEAEDGMEIKPNCTYIIPPNRDMALLGGKLQLFELNSPRGVRHPIDFFFRSLAADQHERSICIVLSGTGSDGTLGVRAVKGEGGMAMAQTPESTEFDGMPRSAIATGLVDYVSRPAEMPAQLIAYANLIANRSLTFLSAPQQSKDTLAKIAVLLRAQTGHDFSQYKETTIIRRVERRMALHQIERIADYLRYMQQNSGEVSALFRDLLIGVTSFFRDAEAFVALENVAIPQMIKSASACGTLRVWVCGCSTGEEAYSVAILIQEQLERLQQVCRVQIFATDVDHHATDQARAGVFPASIAADVSSERLARFFKQDAGGFYRIEKVIRDQLVFSEQDVLKDPPFSKLNFISCRNLLIYLSADVQKRLIPLFHYALNPGGILFLGSAETVGDHHLLFDVLDRKTKLYCRKSDGSGDLRPQLGGLVSLSLDPGPSYMPASKAVRPRKVNFRELTERALLNHFTSAAILVNGRGEILYFHGRTGNYLEPAPGDAASNVLAMAREGLRRDLTAALHRVVAKREPIYVNGLQVKANGHHVMVNLSILPAGVSAPELPDLFLVILEERPQQDLPQPSLAADVSGVGAGSEGRITALEQKLREKDEYIRTMVEEMETSSEELKSSNEELQSVNEEMQSANEELETSREELQSVNEELATVNAELQQKVADLSRANNDMNNLLAGTGVGTLFVDHQLRIARFTPSITHIINFIETDVGRPLADIVSNIVGYDHLLADTQAVLDTLVPVELEVQTKAGSWYLLAVRPYRTLENVIEGAVITFVDITKRKFAEQALVETDRFRHAAQIETVGIAFFQIDGALTSANEAFLHMINYSHEDLEAGKIVWDLITPPEWRPHHLKAMEDLKTTGRTTPYEREYLRKDGSRGAGLFASWRLPEGEAVVYVIGVAPDMFHPPATFP